MLSIVATDIICLITTATLSATKLQTFWLAATSRLTSPTCHRKYCRRKTFTRSRVLLLLLLLWRPSSESVAETRRPVVQVHWLTMNGERHDTYNNTKSRSTNRAGAPYNNKNKSVRTIKQNSSSRFLNTLVSVMSCKSDGRVFQAAGPE